MQKAPDAFRTISEVADDLDVPQHVLRFWETRFTQIKPMKRSGGRRYYRPEDVTLLRGIRHMLYGEGYTIRGVQRILREQGIKSLQRLADAGASNDSRIIADDEDVEEVDAQEIDTEETDVEEIDADAGGDGDEAKETAPVAAAPRARGIDTARAPQSPQSASGAAKLSQDNLTRLRSVLDDLQACRAMLDGALARETDTPLV